MDCVVGVVVAVKRGGGGNLTRVIFPAKNGDRCGDYAVITTQGKSLESPCEAPFLARKSFREQLQVKFSFSQNAVFSAKILESHIALESKNLDSSSSLSLRDTAPAVARQSTSAKNAKVDSRNDYSANAEFMDCHDFASAKSRNDGNRVFYPNAASKKADSRSEAKTLNNSAKDSRIFDKTAQSVFDSHLAGGRICDEKVGLCSLLRGDKTGGLSHKQKANSPLFRAKPTPKPSQAESFNKPQRLAL